MGFVRVAGVSDVPVDGICRIEVDGYVIALANAGGQFYAVQDECTHAEASLSEGEVVGKQIECPLHGGRFDLASGAVRSLPPVVPVATYDVKIDGDDVFVRLP